MYHVYVIHNSSDEIYVGLTKSLEKRLKQHRAGKTISTRKGCRDWQLLHSWYCPTYILASKLERYLHRLQNKHNGVDKVLDIVLDCPVLNKLLVKEILPLPTTPYEIRKYLNDYL